MTNRIIATLLLGASCFANTVAAQLTWYDGAAPVSYNLVGKHSPVVDVALDMFRQDLKSVTDRLPIEKAKGARICIVQYDKATSSQKKELSGLNESLADFAKKHDAFFISVHDNTIYVVGSNGRGTAYGILELSRMAGVSPWVWWSDVVPEKKSKLTIDDSFSTVQSPSVDYRGIFLNDEDWSLQPWSWMTFEKGNPKGRIGTKTYKEIFKLLLRLRANAIWPGMHGITTPFYMVPGAKEMADSCGIVIGTSHCEPLMRNNVGEWDVKTRGDYNYITNRKAVQDYWIERLKEVGKSENFYTIGMRGIHDGSMEGVSTMDEKVKALQQVIDDQRELLAKYVDKNVETIPQQFVPYKEVLDIMENGLQVPDDVTLTWCDDNYGYMTRLSDAEQQKRKGGAGVYYHLSYWGRPHDYMWLCTTQPGLIYNEMRAAYDHNARKLWIVNVHDLKPAAYDLELFLDMAWNIDCVAPNTLEDHLENWLCREFGDEAGKRLLPAMVEYYRLCGIRKPEHMGWTQVELDKRRYPRGRSQVIDTEFSLTEFGGELDRYLNDYEAMKHTIADVEKIIPTRLKDAYYSHIKYQTFAAAAMAQKMLEAQRARSLAMGQCDTSLWTRNDALLTACSKSMNAYKEIQSLTDYYNNTMAGGRWKYSMHYYPRDLNVFNPPTLPVYPTDKECGVRSEECGVNSSTMSNASLVRSENDYIARNACDYDSSTSANNSSLLTPHSSLIQLLGHSMCAVSLPKGKSLTYKFECEREGEATLYTAAIPTQPNDKGDLRYSVSIDGEEPQVISLKEKGRTPTWKTNVLRGQALKTTKHNLTKGTHTLTIKALDDHVVMDQWMIDFKADRKFYVIPTRVDNKSTK